MKKASKKSTERQLKTLSNRLDIVFSKWIRKRDGRCVVCGQTYVLQNGHLITRGVKSLRWDEKNCNCQCSGCNYRHEFRPEIYTAWFVAKYGTEEYMELVRRSKKIKKWTIDELKELIERYS